MKRLLVSALGALALGLAGEVRAQDKAQDKLPSTPPIAKEVGAPVILQGGACDNGGCCNGCNNSGGHVVGGIGLYFVQPNFETNPIGRFSTVDQVNKQFSTRQADFRYSVDTAPTFWLGYVNECGFGLRVRYFQYAHGAGDTFDVPSGTVFTPASPLGINDVFGQNIISQLGGAGGTVDASSHLSVLTWDLEATQRWGCGCWTIEGAAGIRYAHVAQNYHVSAHQTLNQEINVDILQTIDSGHNFNGAGPTIAFEARRRLGDGGLALYGNARASVLFGSAHQQAFGSIQESFNGQSVAINLDSFAHQADVLGVGELEVGVEYSRCMGRGSLLLQLGFVGQIWLGGGNAANVDLGLASDNGTNFGFVGFVLRAGITY